MICKNTLNYFSDVLVLKYSKDEWIYGFLDASIMVEFYFEWESLIDNHYRVYSNYDYAVFIKYLNNKAHKSFFFDGLAANEQMKRFDEAQLNMTTTIRNISNNLLWTVV